MNNEHSATPANPFTVGNHVEAGTGEDYDWGSVIAIDGDSVEVAWDGSLCRTTQHHSILSVRS